MPRTNPQQLMATKDKKDKKIRISVPGGSGVSRELEQKFKRCKSAEIPHLGSLRSGGQKFPDKSWTMIHIFGSHILRMELHRPSAERSFRKKMRKFETKFPKIWLKFAPKFLVLSWQVEKSYPQISPDISHQRFQISNQISPKNFTTQVCRHGNPKDVVRLNDRIHRANSSHSLKFFVERLLA